MAAFPRPPERIALAPQAAPWPTSEVWVFVPNNAVRQVEVSGMAQQTLADQAQSSVEQVSGVNLDEEAANLLRYQQAYQASAKLIDIAGRLFDEILALGR